jgi:hypothetical protein
VTSRSVSVGGGTSLARYSQWQNPRVPNRDSRDSLAAGLDRARDGKLDAIAGRGSVIDRIGQLVGA